MHTPECGLYQVSFRFESESKASIERHPVERLFLDRTRYDRGNREGSSPGNRARTRCDAAVTATAVLKRPHLP